MAKKYIDAELLRKAVEKQIDYAKGIYPKGSIEEARASAITAVYRNILASIDSLQQEQPCDTCTNDKGCVACKDALLGWAKEQLDILNKQTLLHPDDEVFWGQRNAFKQLIDKLNEM